MKLHVHFRFNKSTGEVEIFQIEDQGPPLPEAEHNRRHDARSAEIGRVVERFPLVREVLPGAVPLPDGAERTPDAPQPQTERPAETARVRG
jgi:hypothetical protein